MLGGQQAVAQQDGAPHDVAELTHVAWPVVLQQARLGCAHEAVYVVLHLDARLVEEAPCKYGHVLPPRA